MSVVTCRVSSDECLVLLRGVDSLAGAGMNGDGDRKAVFKNPELFENFGAFQRGRGEVLIRIQKGAAVDIQANMTEQTGFAGASGAMVGDGTAAEIQRMSSAIRDNFDNRWIARVFIRGKGGGDGGHRHGRIGCLEGGHGGIDCAGIHFRFIALNIDDDVGCGEVESVSSFGQSAGAAGVIDAGHDDLGIETAASIGNFLRIHGEDQAIQGACLASRLPHVLNEWLSRLVQENLAG